MSSSGNAWAEIRDPQYHNNRHTTNEIREYLQQLGPLNPKKGFLNSHGEPCATNHTWSLWWIRVYKKVVKWLIWLWSTIKGLSCGDHLQQWRRVWALHNPTSYQFCFNNAGHIFIHTWIKPYYKTCNKVYVKFILFESNPNWVWVQKI